MVNNGTTNGTITSKVGRVMYKVKCCNEMYEKHIDQLRFYPEIETIRAKHNTTSYNPYY